MKYVSTTKRQTIVEEEKLLFTGGKEIPKKKLREWFSIIKPKRHKTTTNKAYNQKVINYSLHMLTAYTAMNRTLAGKGLVIKNSKGKYEIQSSHGTFKKIDTLYKEAKGKKKRGDKLLAGKVKNLNVKVKNLRIKVEK